MTKPDDDIMSSSEEQALEILSIIKNEEDETLKTTMKNEEDKEDDKVDRMEGDNNSEFDEVLPQEVISLLTGRVVAGEGNIEMTDSEKIATSAQATRRSALVVLFCVFADAVNAYAVAPNYPILTLPDAHPDSFPNTDPMDYTAAQYMIVMATGVGFLISNLLGGTLADKIGKKKILLTNLIVSSALLIVKYFARTYWFFVGISFINGLFGSSPAVGLGYMGDIFQTDRSKADAYMGYVIAAVVFGRSAGGLLTMLTPNKLFSPLLIAAVVTFLGFLVGWKYILEPSHLREVFGDNTKEKSNETEDSNEGEKRNQIETLDKCAFYNIVVGALFDNAGSTGLVPFCLTPLMFNTYYADMVEAGISPVMSEQAFRAIYSLTAIIAVPGALISPGMYQKIGIVFSCCAANVVTGGVILACLFVSFATPTTGTFAAFVIILYSGFSFAIISQLTTGPMLDRIAPLDKKAFVQGVNASLFDVGSAFFPFVYGILTDKHGVEITLYICAGISFIAGIVNFPLAYHPFLQNFGKDSDVHDDVTAASIDEADVQERLSKGEYVPSRVIWKVNIDRATCGKPFLRQTPGKYIPGSGLDAVLPREDYIFLRDTVQNQLLRLTTPEHGVLLSKAINQLQMDRIAAKAWKEEMGKWFTDYLDDNGYFPGEECQLLKSVFAEAFPKLSDSTVTPQTLKPRWIILMKLLNDLIEKKENKDNLDVFVVGGNLPKRASVYKN